MCTTFILLLSPPIELEREGGRDRGRRKEGGQQLEGEGGGWRMWENGRGIK